MSLEQNKFDVVVSQSFNDEITGQLDAMLEKDVRIILGNFNESWARYTLQCLIPSMKRHENLMKFLIKCAAIAF
jgi:hypothetical protein